MCYLKRHFGAFVELRQPHPGGRPGGVPEELFVRGQDADEAELAVARDDGVEEADVVARGPRHALLRREREGERREREGRESVR